MSATIEKSVNRIFDHWRELPRENDALAPNLETFFNDLKPEFRPYVVLVDVIGDYQWAVRLFGTGRLNSFGRDVKKINPLEIYVPDLRSTVAEKVKMVLGQPCGYRSVHRLRTAKGLDHVQTGVTLPLKTDEGSPQCIVNFVNSNEPIAHDDRKGMVEEILNWNWMDIGAGLPPPK